jgi:hypothetical protein
MLHFVISTGTRAPYHNLSPLIVKLEAATALVYERLAYGPRASDIAVRLKRVIAKN